MKLQSLAIGIWFSVLTCTSAQVELTLEEMLARTKSEAKSERVIGFELLGKFWSPQVNHSGFSDTLIKTERSNAQKLSISDQDLDAIAYAIEKGISDTDSDVRNAAAAALYYAPRSSDAVQAAILAGLNSPDTAVNSYVSQQRTNVWPKLERVIDRTLENLISESLGHRFAAGELLRKYGTEASKYSKRILEAILGVEASEDRRLSFYVLCDIALTEDAMRLLVNRVDELNEKEIVVAAVSLLEYPEALSILDAKHPKLVEALESHSARLFPFLCKHQYEPHKTRDWLASKETLPANIMGMLGESRFIEKLDLLGADANSYERTFLEGCKRACGAQAKSVVDIDSSNSGSFRPASAWPNTDGRRISKSMAGHGDGVVQVMVTGSIRSKDDSIPEEVVFYQTNDSMLLGTEENIRQPILYNRQNGRFVYLTTVFAAFNMGSDQLEPGPYQTGSAQIRIEADGCKPLVVQFFDEMPDVKITLDANK